MPDDNKEQLLITEHSLSLGGWEVAKLKKLGKYHPLELSHVSFPRAHLETVLGRLSEGLRALSCSVSHHNHGLSASCHTMERVSFQVSFYEKNPNEDMGETDLELTETISEKNGVVVMELQRLCGDSFTFHQYVRQILDTVEGKKNSDQRFDMNDFSYGRFLDELVNPSNTVGIRDLEFAMKRAEKLITAHSIYDRQMGLETLQTFTDAKQTGIFVASKVSRELLMPSTESSNKLASDMLRYLLDPTTEGVLSYAALHVWSSVFQIASNDPGTTWEAFFDALCPLDVLVGRLQWHVEQVHNHPHEATMALVALAALQKAAPHRIGPNISWCAVQQANAVGRAHHAALERASLKFMKAC